MSLGIHPVIETSLLEAAPCPEVVDLIIKPKLAAKEPIRSLPSEPTDETIKLVLRNSDQYTAAAFARVVSARVHLERFYFKDKRKLVRVALVENPNLPFEFLIGLLEEGLNEFHEDLLVAIMKQYSYFEVQKAFDALKNPKYKKDPYRTNILLYLLAVSIVSSKDWFQWFLKVNKERELLKANAHKDFREELEGIKVPDGYYAFDSILRNFLYPGSSVSDEFILKTILDPANGFTSKRFTLLKPDSSPYSPTQACASAALFLRFAKNPKAYLKLENENIFTHHIFRFPPNEKKTGDLSDVERIIKGSLETEIKNFDWSPQLAALLFTSDLNMDLTDARRLFFSITDEGARRDIFSASWETLGLKLDPEDFIFDFKHPKAEKVEMAAFQRSKFNYKTKPSRAQRFSCIVTASGPYLSPCQVQTVLENALHNHVAPQLLESNPHLTPDQRFNLASLPDVNPDLWFSNSSLTELETYLLRFNENHRDMFAYHTPYLFTFEDPRAQLALKTLPLKSMMAPLGVPMPSPVLRLESEPSTLDPFREHLVKWLTKPLGEDLLKWSTFLTLLPQWSGTPQELIDSVETLS